MIRYILLMILALSCSNFGIAQEAINWWNPEQHPFDVVEGQAAPSESTDFYSRLPDRLEARVREPVWGLSRHAAGLLIRFRSDADQIRVRYQVPDLAAMDHMPATGASGVDLYAIDSEGQWHWARARRNFGDTIQYNFTQLRPNDERHEFGREYRLYLPLYNAVSTLEIGTPEGCLFRPLPARLEKPIVIYGTSIAQGACASRPGMAWTNILGRKMDRPLINLAFSGNGRLEPELIGLLTEIDAAVFVLDCLPNLTNPEAYPRENLQQRIREAVTSLRKARPEASILLVDHAGYTDGGLVTARKTAYERVNLIQQQTYSELIAEGVHNLYYLDRKSLALGLDDMVDGTHPNDLGMQHYAEAYETALRKILHEPVGAVSTTIPCTQAREPHNYNWEDRHRSILEMNRTDPPKSVIFANSIIHFWGGLPEASIQRESGSWEKVFTPAGVRNYAYGWDRIENVLWRIYHGELDGFAAKSITLMIGTNNLHLNNDDEILDGLELVLQAAKTRQPEAIITILGILPRRDQEERIFNLNLKISRLAGTYGIRYGDVGYVFLQEDGKIREEFFSDGLHPNEMGYLHLRDAIAPYLLQP